MGVIKTKHYQKCRDSLSLPYSPLSLLRPRLIAEDGDTNISAVISPLASLARRENFPERSPSPSPTKRALTPRLLPGSTTSSKRRLLMKCPPPPVFTPLISALESPLPI